jgi:hypothetical protein
VPDDLCAQSGQIGCQTKHQGTDLGLIAPMSSVDIGVLPKTIQSGAAHQNVPSIPKSLQKEDFMLALLAVHAYLLKESPNVYVNH